MLWIDPSGKNIVTAALERRLCDAAEQFRANSGLKSREYSVAVPRFVGAIRHGNKVNSYSCDLHNVSYRFSANITNRAAYN